MCTLTSNKNDINISAELENDPRTCILVMM